MLPVPASSFYGPWTESLTPLTPPAVIDPVLLAGDTHVAALIISGPEHPWMEPGQAKVIKHEVMRIVQPKGFCQNREPDTLKNKVSSLLAWLEGGKQKKARSPLGRELDSNLAGFAALSRKLDAIQHLKLQAKETCEDQKEHVKEAQNWLRAAGEILHVSMMHGHKHMTTKRTWPSTPSSDARRIPVVKRPRGRDSPVVARLMEKNDERKDRKEQKMEQFHVSLLERHNRAIDIQEWTSTALLEILFKVLSLFILLNPELKIISK
ncbi:hypothetical protein JB92DRAFT_2829414 [Gautieria morchelliformis]|nr:hypothetical protein JB92DRAFT_2829414 [Gautieria morchelliformis]